MRSEGVPQDLARVWGLAHLVGGERLPGNVPFFVLLTKEGGVVFSGG